jgi:Uma2 family endonuclease
MGDTLISTNPLAVLVPQKTPRDYTLAEYLRREERATELHEYYDGNIIKLPMARGPHNEIVGNMTAALKAAIKGAPKTFRLFTGQQLVYLPALNYGLYPDVLVVCEAPKYWDNNQVLLINPILIVEVLSKSTKKYDRTEKFGEYKTLPSFQEYVLIDPNKCHIESRFREEPNLWRDTYSTKLEESLYLKSLGCSLDLVDIYENIVLKK